MRYTIALAGMVLIWAVGLTALGPVGLASIVLPDAPTIAPPASVPSNQADAVTNPNAGPAGIYVFYDFMNLDPAQYPIQGGHITTPWSRIEVGPGVYDWSFVDDWLAGQASLNKKVGLGFNTYDGECCGGSGVPAYIRQRYPSSTVSCNGVEIPRYWDPDFQRAYGEFIRVLGQRYDGDPMVAWVEIGVGIYGETGPAEEAYYDCLRNAGLTSKIWVDVVKWHIDTYLDAFPNTQLLLQFAPVFEQRAERVEFTDYAAMRGVGLKHNGLKPDGGGDAVIDDPSLSYYQGGQYDPILKWGDQVATGWEAYENQGGSLRGRTDSMWGILNALDKHADYLVLDTDLIRASDRQDLLEFANAYLGRTLADTPSVWTALRETEYDWFPDYGNFEFWLYQNDDAPGGKTVPLWNVGSAAEGRYARRTDQVSGNDTMFFDVDNRYMFGGRSWAKITVTYYDQGTDRWGLFYDAVDDPDKLAGYIYKTNSYTWKQATFTLADAHFADRQAGNTDFHIWSADDGDEIIHLVDVVRPAGVTVETVLQQDVEGYAGVTDTTLNAWTPDVNSGSQELMRLRFNQGGSITTHMAPLVRFDLTDVPRDADIVEAHLELYLAEGERTDRDMRAEVRGLLRAWDESMATWNRPAVGATWATVGAQAIGADQMTWTADSQLVKLPAGWVSFDVSELVKLWVKTPESNHGMILMAGPGTAPTNFELRFATRDHSNGELRPKLSLKYVIPAPEVPTPTPTATPTVTRTPAPPTATPTATVPPRTLVSPYASSPPSVDGDLGEWTQSDMITVDAFTADHRDGAEIPTAADISARVLSLWAEGWLYFAARIEDQTVLADSAVIWDDDGIEIALDGAFDRVSGNADDHQFTVASDSRLKRFGVYDVPGAQVAVRKRPGGYDVELALPASLLAAGELVSDKTLGFSVGLIDDDDGGGRTGSQDNYLIWEGDNTVSGAPDYGMLVLGERHDPPTATVTATSTPTATSAPTITSTPTATASQTPAHTPTLTRTPTHTQTPSPTATATATATATSTVTVTHTPTPDTGALSGLAYHDRNGNAIWDDGEPGLGGATLVLKRDLQEMYVTVSGADGRYRFERIQPGQYMFQEKSPPPGGYEHNPLAVVIEIRANQSLDGLNIGHQLAATATPTWMITPTATLTPTGTPMPQHRRYLPFVLNTR